MKCFFLCLAFFAATLQADNYFPEVELDELFVAVQLKPVFSDSKIFVDSNPKLDPAQILALYRQNPAVDLDQFVNTYFYVHQFHPEDFFRDGREPMKEYIFRLWDLLERNSIQATQEVTTLIGLPNPYIVPGERFSEMYYWDSYFIMLGLGLSNRWELVEKIVENFAFLIDRFGFIPNGNRTYYLTRSQPPFFSLMLNFYAEHFGVQKALRFLPQLEKEYAFWMEQRSAFQGLNHYDDASDTPRPESYRVDVEKQGTAEFYRNVRATAESGWDFSSRWLDNMGTLQTIQILPVDLNCVLYAHEKILADFYIWSGNEEQALQFNQLAERRKETIRDLFWNAQAGFFEDFNFVTQSHTGRLTLAGVFPLLFQIADESQATQVKDRLEQNFLKPGGLVTTLEDSGEQWDFPNGWAPLQWVATIGLMNYGYNELAEEVMRRWLNMLNTQFLKTGRLLEKYNVVDLEIEAFGGEYALQTGFGWTNAIALLFMHQLSQRNHNFLSNLKAKWIEPTWNANLLSKKLKIH